MWTFDEKYSNFRTTHKRIQISEKCIGHGVGKSEYHSFHDGMVPENDIHSIELLNKTFHSKPQMKYYKTYSDPVEPKIL